MTSRAGIDYYAFLGVSHDATQDEIKRAYRRLSRKLHPDANPEAIEWATEQFKLLQKVYEVLGNAGRRNAYDARRSASSESARPRSSTGYERPSTEPRSHVRYSAEPPMTSPLGPIVLDAIRMAIGGAFFLGIVLMLDVWIAATAGYAASFTSNFVRLATIWGLLGCIGLILGAIFNFRIGKRELHWEDRIPAWLVFVFWTEALIGLWFTNVYLISGWSFGLWGPPVIVLCTFVLLLRNLWNEHTNS